MRMAGRTLMRMLRGREPRYLWGAVGLLVEEELAQASARLSLATRAGGVGIWDYDVLNDTLTWDEQMFALYGITREPFGGAYEAWQAGLHPDDRERGDEAIQLALRGEQEFDTEFRVLWPDGNERIIRALALALAAANATITRIAATDDLSGLANRRHFYESLENAVSLARRHGTPLALVSLDLDGLKRVNDSAGHEAGDEVLTSFAALLAALCRAEDLPARLGGDEFSVLLPGMELNGAHGLAERVLAAVRACEALTRRRVTVSGGVAQWTPNELPDDLLRRADEALYAAKRAGGDAVKSDA